MLKEVRSFLGFSNFYRKFIDHYSEKAEPLNRLTRKDQPWTWEKEQERAFADMKKAFVEEVVLAAPNPEEQYFMARVRHGYGKTRGVSKTGITGMGTVVDFG